MVKRRFSIGRCGVLQHGPTLKETISQTIRTISHNKESWQISLWAQDSAHMEVYSSHYQWVISSYVTSIFEQQSQKSDNRIVNPIDQTNIQEVGEILDSRWRGGKLQYLIKWKGQSLEERTWKNRDEVVKGAPRSCKEFHQKYPDAPRVPIIRLPAKMYADIARTRS